MRVSELVMAAALAVALAGAAAAQTETTPRGEGTGAGESTSGMDMQSARAKMMTARGRAVAYPPKFDLSALASYQPKTRVSGVLRIWGSNYITDGMVGGYWEQAFRKHHPGIRIQWRMKTTEAAVPSLVFGVSDLGIGRNLTFSEQQLYERYTDRDPLQLDIATGSYDVPGWNPGFGVQVNKDNPLQQITMEQLDGVFGAERTGGWEGTSWHAEWARGPEKNIRTWGQLGATGEWADKPIHVYGLNLRYHQSAEVSDMILKGSDKWNEKLRMYANYVTADGKLARSMNQDLAADRYGIGIVAAPTTDLGRGKGQAQLKILPLARTSAGPYVPYTLDTIHDRSYPMFDHIFAYANMGPGLPADPKVVEFLRFILSREGQAAIMRDGKYLPLTAEVLQAQLAKLEAATRGRP